MVNQVNDKSFSQLTGLATVGGGAARPQPVPSEVQPAVRLDLSQATQSGKAAVSGADLVSSSSLVKEIRERVESGRFVIDYEQIGQSLLREVVARATGREGKP